MRVNSSREENVRRGMTAGAGSARVRQLPQVLRRWSRDRLAVAALTAVLSAVLMVANGMIAGAGGSWTGWALVGTGSVLAGFLVGSYVNAPIGAGATLCDLRWPVLGLIGAAWAGSSGEAVPAARIAAGLLSLAVMVWALHGRLELEREVTMGRGGLLDSGTDACTTGCRPLSALKPGSGR
ncbi:hypothetical protein [Pseudarthrobacter oxydans]|uniref:hypothetical protein n=1 Tax=Pseudarthrobacter oxydans TaxID=1671 RepID=UPI0037F3080F